MLWQKWRSGLVDRKTEIFNMLKTVSMQMYQADSENMSGIDSNILAKRMHMDRANVSRILNELVREKRVVKSDTRPVKFVDTDTFQKLNKTKSEMKECMGKKDVFESFVGSDGSLQLQVRHAKAAILYPPNGLHTLLTGETGTGKTTFAERMYEYAKENQILPEYADNPQLLLSQLFGYTKGAFTGANSSKPGLIELADNGILFLDEIHRLPSEGQEMLFMLMDKGIYRRMGETEGTRKAKVLIVGATTENIDTVLMKTFLRRMSMAIKLPSLVERPLTERFALIEDFFLSEYCKIKCPIAVSRDVIMAMVLNQCQSNIGQLKADIQLLCAKGFWEYKEKRRTRVEINMDILPEYIKNSSLNNYREQSGFIDVLRYTGSYYVFSDNYKRLEVKIKKLNHGKHVVICCIIICQIILIL